MIMRAALKLYRAALVTFILNHICYTTWPDHH